jgi:hypothetical protein
VAEGIRRGMELDTLLLFVLVFLAAVIGVLISEGNRKIEKLNERLQTFWEEYVRKGGTRDWP